LANPLEHQCSRATTSPGCGANSRRSSPPHVPHSKLLCNHAAFAPPLRTEARVPDQARSPQADHRSPPRRVSRALGHPPARTACSRQVDHAPAVAGCGARNPRPCTGDQGWRLGLSIKNELMSLEARHAELTQPLEAPEIPQLRHPRMADVYRERSGPFATPWSTR
jgi:hypothetical protein